MWVETPQPNVLATLRCFRRLVFRSDIVFSSRNEISSPNKRQGCTMRNGTLVVSFFSCIDDGWSSSFPSYAHVSPSTRPFFHVHSIILPSTSFVVVLHLWTCTAFPPSSGRSICPRDSGSRFPLPADQTVRASGPPSPIPLSFPLRPRVSVPETERG